MKDGCSDFQRVEGSAGPAASLSPLLSCFTKSALLLSLMQPVVAGALGIGEVEMLSKWGEPFHARVALRLRASELSQSECLSLIPEAHEKSQENTLRRATVRLQSEKGSHSAVITTHEPFMALYGSFTIRLGCAGQGEVEKSFAVLPDLPVAVERIGESPEQPSIAMAQKSGDNTDAEPSKPAARVEATAKALKKTNKRASTSSRPRKREKPLRNKPSGQAGEFMLKLSSSSLDLTRTGKLSAADRAALAEQKKILDGDDAIARTLEMQYQIKVLSDELAVMKLKISRLESLTASMAPTAGRAAETTPAPVERGSIRWVAWLVAGLILAALAAFLWMRVRRRKDVTVPVQVEDRESHADTDTQEAEPRALTSPPKEEVGERTAAYYSIASSMLVQDENASSGDEHIHTLLEEAHLYAKHGRLGRATEILRDLLEQHPECDEAWLRLLSVYSALCDVQHFETYATRFKVRQPEPDVWSRVQALGRSLDAENSLYVEQDPGLTEDLSRPVRKIVVPVGSVLVESGALSLTDLNNCLSEYDPKVDGRFGNYLVSRKLISVEQLTNALLHQQGITSIVEKVDPTAERAGKEKLPDSVDDAGLGATPAESDPDLEKGSPDGMDIHGKDESAKPDDAPLDFEIDFDTGLLGKK